jgi:hypothetical protein
MAFAARLSALIAAIAFCANACSSQPSTVLQPSDLTAPAGKVFNPNEILAPDADFRDDVQVSEAVVQAFLEKTPYGSRSFLATYTSEGVRASAAIRRASLRYRINPIVILAKLQAVQGLVGERLYPNDSVRVEFVFGCGCNGRSECDPAFAGLSKQVECFARDLNASFVQVAAGQPTKVGFAPALTTLTYDGVKVTPTNFATAALYDWEPRVSTGRGGAWMVWSLWNKYGSAMQYQGSKGADGVLGASCDVETGCGATNLCVTGSTTGVCSARCKTAAQCTGASAAACVNLGPTDTAVDGYCFVTCVDDTSCEPGLTCTSRQVQGAGAKVLVCTPP